ncbi:hypothetical protein L1887_22878 [Cichorium endivia]|nr:hypothetical protein L1887_22878 [Cichorium endivia]
MLEAVASHDLWIWHAFFGVAGSNNDINVLNESPIFNDILTGKAPDCPFVVNRNEYKHGYYLLDGIYPEYATFVKAYQHPVDEKRKMFKAAQESARKDVERAFGVLKKRFDIIKYPSRAWDKDNIANIMYMCIILHNMILEEKGPAICMYNPHDAANPHQKFVPGSLQYFARVLEIHSKKTHDNLRHDLTEHIYENRMEHDDDDEE